jgi:hypothetical protein
VSNIEAALMNPELSELSKEYPRAAFAHTNGAIVRQVVEAMKQGLFKANIGLRLRLEPPNGMLDTKGRQRPPQRLIVKDRDCHWRIGIEVHENSLFIGERLCVTSTCDDPVAKVSKAIADAINECLGLSNATPRGQVTTGEA